MTVVVPTFNEASNIRARLENLALVRYPSGSLDVIVVDSGSSDGTADEAVRAAGENPLPVTVIRETERRGKAAAINSAIAAARGDIIVVTDAPTVFDTMALTRIATAFDDAEVGAASGHFEVTGEGSALQDEEASFWRVRNRLRALEAGVDSTPFLSGELCAFRRGLVKRLDEDTLADDMNIALQVRAKGKRVAIVEEARFSERRSAASAELLETKSRRAAGGIQELLRYRSMMFRPAHGLFGLLILPSAFFYYLPLRVPALVMLAFVTLKELRRAPAMLQVGAILGSVAVTPGVIARSRQIGMLFFNEWIFIQGWRRVLGRSMDVRWSQERSTREAAGAGASER